MVFIDLVEDEADLAQLLRFQFEQLGHEVRVFPCAEDFFRGVEERVPQLVVLDVMLPGVSGLAICRRLRASHVTERASILVLSALGQESDRIAGLEAGADDYVSKPFSVKELLLRAQALLSRASVRGVIPPTKTIECGPLRVEPDAFRCFVDGELISLTSLELKLLLHFIERKGRVQTREQLLSDVWEMHGRFETRTVDTHIMRLREKLKGARDCLQTIRGVGYRFVASPDEAL